MGSGSAGWNGEDPQDVILHYRQRIDELQAQLESENNAHRATLEALRDCSKQLAAQSAQLKAAREALTIASKSLDHCDSIAWKCPSWCPRCLVDKTLSALDGEVKKGDESERN